MATDNLILSHPKFQQMQDYGVGTPSQMYAAMYTYLDLTEVKLWSEVKVRPCRALRAVYLTGRQNQAAPVQLVMPLSSSGQDNAVSMERVAALCAALRRSEQDRGLEEREREGERGSEEEREIKDGLTLALVGSDSTVLYYHVWEGIHQLTHTHTHTHTSEFMYIIMSECTNEMK